MATKNNIRSFRYSDEIACILNSQPGDNMNAKFERFVETCYCEQERKQEQLDRIDAEIEKRRQVLRDLSRATAELVQLEKDIQSAKFYFGIVQRRAAAIAEKVDKL